jgi:hypothetical protein
MNPKETISPSAATFLAHLRAGLAADARGKPR